MHENLRSFVGIHTDHLMGIRDHYLKNITRDITIRGSEADLPFSSKAMYESWVSFAPFFFREFYTAYSTFIESSHTHEQIIQHLDNNLRIVRYFTHLLLPGAYLDEFHSTEDKKEFLDRFSSNISNRMYRKKYSSPELENLFIPESFSDRRKTAISGIIPILEEACELLYLGDQNVGYTDFGLDKSFLPDHYILYQDFDLNRGQRIHPEIGKIQTCTVYPKHWETDNPFVMVANVTTGSIFQHGFWSEGKWKNGRPGSSQLRNGYIIHNGTSLTTGSISTLSEALLKVINSVEKSRVCQSEQEQKLEYCYTQSTPIRNLFEQLGYRWDLPVDAKDEIINMNIVKRLKREWSLITSVEVANRLIRESITWANQN